MKFAPHLFIAAALVISAPAAVITQWNFNSDPADGSGTTGSSAPSIGAGTASTLASVLATFGSGAANGGSSDPATIDDTAWQTTTYAAPTTGDLGSGVQFLVDTTGYSDISISYDLRHSNTSSRYEAVQYTLNGSTWQTVAFFDGNAGDTWFNGRTVDLSAITGAGDNPNFGIRIVAAFESTATGAGADNYAGSSSGYAATGTWRFDMVTVSGTAVPEPAAALLGSLGLLGLLRRRR